MAEQADEACTETELLGYELSGQSIDNEGSKRLIAALPGMNRLSEEGSISHHCYNNMTITILNTKTQIEKKKASGGDSKGMA
jgi:hypothetical protein